MRRAGWASRRPRRSPQGRVVALLAPLELAVAVQGLPFEKDCDAGWNTGLACTCGLAVPRETLFLDDALCLKGQAEFTLKRFDDAEQSFRRSLALSPQNDISTFYLARVCFNRERYDEVIRLLRPLLDRQDLRVDRLQVIALTGHASRLEARQTRAPVP